MSANATSKTGEVSGRWSAPAKLLRLEKPRETSTSGDPARDFRERRAPRPARRAACRFETEGVSRWNGPVLQASYAAQVIAQALDIAEPLSARGSYRKPLPATPWLCDRTV
jgi:hypothetical protein